MTLQIFSAWASDREPPNTVKSCEKTKTRRPLTVPWPVTTPSPGTFCSCMPKSAQRCSTNMSHSSNEPSSSSSSIRSRAVSLPLACWLSTRRSPPPARAAARICSSLARTSCMIRRFPRTTRHLNARAPEPSSASQNGSAPYLHPWQACNVCQLTKERTCKLLRQEGQSACKVCEFLDIDEYAKEAVSWL